MRCVRVCEGWRCGSALISIWCVFFVFVSLCAVLSPSHCRRRWVLLLPHGKTVRSLRCVLDLGVGTRGPRIAWAAMHTRACAATRWGTPCLKFVAPHGLRLPGDKGDERSTVAIGRCSASARRGVRGGVRGDLGWWSRNVGQGGRSHLLYGALPFGAPLMLCVLLLKCALSGTLAFLRHHNCHLAQE